MTGDAGRGERWCGWPGRGLALDQRTRDSSTGGGRQSSWFQTTRLGGQTWVLEPVQILF